MSKAKVKSIRWPSDGQLKSWLTCYISCVSKSETPVKAAAKAQSSIEHLAAIGDEAKAIRMLNALIECLPKNEVKQYVRLCLLGASIRLDMASQPGARKYLKMATDRAELAGREQSKTVAAVDEFLAMNGLVECELDEFDDSFALAEFGKTRLLYHAAVKKNDDSAAKKALGKMRKLIVDVDFFWIQSKLVLKVIKGYQRIGEMDEIEKYIRWLDRNGHDNDLKNGNLAALVSIDSAADRAYRLIQANLKELRSSDDLNVHFPVDTICENVDFLCFLGEDDVAATCFSKTLQQLPSWPGLAAGFATSGAFTQLAEIAADFGESELANEILDSALDLGRVERNRGFRASAIKAASQSAARCGSTSDRIEEVRKMRSSKAQRKKLVPLLVKVGDWKGLKKMLADVDQPKEATQLALEVKNALPAGIWL